MLGEIFGKIPEIWKRMANGEGYVNSNYGYQWQRNDQLDKVIELLKSNPKTRQAAISIYDAKEYEDKCYGTNNYVSGPCQQAEGSADGQS